MLVKQGQAVFKSKISSILTNFDQWKMWKAKTEQCWKTILENYLLVDLKRQNDKQTRKITIKGIINRKRNARWFYFRFFLSRKLIVKKRQMTFWKIYDLNHRLNFETKLSNNWFNFPASPVTIAQKRILYVKKKLMEKYKNVTDKNLRITKLCLPHSGKPVKNRFTWGSPWAMQAISVFFFLL